MNLKKLYKLKNIELLFLAELDVITIKEVIKKLDLSPDYDVSEYGREISKDYYFYNKWSFSPYCKSLIKVEIIGSKIYNPEELKVSLDDCDDEYPICDYEDVESNLNMINNENKSFFIENGYDTSDLDEFKLREVRVREIDNAKQELWYEGGFFGDNIVMDYCTSGFEVFSKFCLIGISNSIRSFYKELLGESYILFQNGNYKLSFFIAFSAFECFINTKGNTQDVNEKLCDKISDLYRCKLGEIDKHEIYTNIRPNFKGYEKTRNIIAHGREDVQISEENVYRMLLDILILILTYERNYNSFDQIYTPDENV